MFPQTLTPDILKRLECLRLQTRRAFHGQREGGHVSPRRGMGLEFSDFRQYEPGDNPRNIDWNAYARTDKLFIKRYREEENLSVVIAIDSSLSMRHERAKDKWTFSKLIALSASYVALNNRDSVRIALSGLPPSPALYGAKAIHDAQRFLDRSEETLKQREANDSLLSTIHQTASSVRFPGLGIIISDFLFPPDEFSRILTALAAKNLELHAIQVLSRDDLLPLEGKRGSSVIDSETQEKLDLSLTDGDRERYSELLFEHIKDLRERAALQQVNFTQVDLNEENLDLLYSTLNNSGLAA